MIKVILKIFDRIFASPRGTISSKRLLAFLIATHAAGFQNYYAILKTDIPPNLTSLVREEWMLVGVLVGSTLFEKKFKNNKEDDGV